MRRRFRRKDYVVEAEESPDGGWLVYDCGSKILMSVEDFARRFEEVSPLHRIAPLRLGFAEEKD